MPSLLSPAFAPLAGKSSLKRGALFASLVLTSSLMSACGGSDHGPYWEYQKVTPAFSIQQDNFSTTFEGHVYPETEFVFGPEDGVSFSTANVKLTVNGAAVWAYEPIFVELYVGERNDVGDPDALVAAFTVEEPELDGSISFSQSQALTRTPQWVRVSFPDFSGQCVLQLLGHH